MVTVVEDVKRAVLSVGDLRGRATRREFWTFLALQCATLALVLALDEWAWWWLFFWAYVAWFVLTVPALVALSVRRLHDTGRSARWLAVVLVPGIGVLLLLALLALPADRSWNRFGPPRGLVPAAS